ncbi:MAG TPA: hypothetical protein VGS17_07825 [Candidatus Limnocylindria bacterium]|nr:hypothetical protein [Candidatus Limnocylindria bacterium]
MQRTFVRFGLAALAAIGLIFASFPAPAAAVGLLGSVQGHVTDLATSLPISNACVWFGPVHIVRSDPLTNCVFTDGAGFYSHSWINGPSTIPLTFEKDPSYQQKTINTVVNSDAPVIVDAALTPTGTTAGCTPPTSGTPTETLYLPNVTKTLGGPSGFQTPFIVQNTGTTSTNLEVTFYKFSDASCVARRSVPNLAPGASFADVPNNDTDLPDNTQFSVTVRSFGNTVVSVVNQHKGVIEADAYSAAATGATTVYLPNVVRRFFGYHSPAIIQNLGQASTVVTARYQSFDGTASTVSITRSISPGQSQFIEPNSDDPVLGAPGLVDGKQYAVTITSAQPVSVVLNTHNDDPGVALPVFYSANGISTGAATVYGAYAVKNANGGRVSTIVVQNLGGGPLTPSLTFTPLLSGGATTTFMAPVPVPAGGSWAFDPRFINGVASSDQTKLCSVAAANCLGNGEYSFTAQGNGGNVAAMVNVIGPDSAMGYTASPTPAATYNLPNVLASYGGWTTPIYLQSVSASSATLNWKPFLGGPATTQTVNLTPGVSVKVDPNISVPQGAQYAVTVAASGGTLTAIVMELNSSGGDNAMIYGGFPAP